MKRFRQVYLPLMMAILVFPIDFNRAQEPGSSSPYVYRPSGIRLAVKDSSQNRWIDSAEKSARDEYSEALPAGFRTDSIQTYGPSTDSLLAREAFVRDSLIQHQHVLDSLRHLQSLLPVLLDASLKTWSDEIIFRTSGVQIIGDTILSPFEADKITFDFTAPYMPWKTRINMPPKLTFDSEGIRIVAMETPQFSYRYSYSGAGDIVLLHSKSAVLNRSSGSVYKTPVDSVYLDHQHRVVKIKHYVQYHSVVNTYQKGAALFTSLEWVKQLRYDSKNALVGYELTRFCERMRSSDPQKVCSQVVYEIALQGGEYRITRKNSPDNEFSDGVFTYTYQGENLSSVAFRNAQGTENRKTIVELNEAGNVSRYLYEKDGKINQTLLVNYQEISGGKLKVETISCMFEDDGISYYQKNNSTGKSRQRDKMTLEWSDWR